MFASKITSTLIAGVIALGGLAVVNSSANAGSRGGLFFDGPGFHLGFGGNHYGRRHFDRYDRWERPRHRRFCRPGKALRKAKRRGIRRAHIVRVGHRGVIVRGRKWGDVVTIGFGRHRSCPVRFVRAY